jgi:hypothetical protein
MASQQPTVVTYPGTVRIKPSKPPPVDEKGKPLVLVPRVSHDAQGRVSTEITVPLGWKLDHVKTGAPPTKGPRARPQFAVTLVKDGPPTPGHAMRATLQHNPATDANAAHVIATSTEHKDEHGDPLTAVGTTAAAAVAALSTAVDWLLKARADAAAEEAKKADEDAKKTAAYVAEELHESKPPPAPVERRG